MKILMVFLIFTLSACIVVPKTVDKNPSLPTIELDGYAFHAETFGDKNNPVAIVLHGGPGADSLYLREASSLLSNDFYVVLYDQRGTGLSPRVPTKDITVDRFISDLNMFANKFSPDRPVRLVGHSWGAMLASAYTSQHPERVSHMVLAEPQFLNGTTIHSMQRGWPGWRVVFGVSGAWINKWRVLTASDPFARDDYYLSKLLLLAQMPGELCDGRLPELTANRFGYPVFQATIGRMMEDDEFAESLSFVDGIENYDGKTLLLTGSCNTLFGAEYQRQHQSFYRNAKIATIENAGHFMFNDQPEESIHLVTEFLQEP